MQVLDVVRDIVRHRMDELAEALNKLSGRRLTPNMVTIAGLVAHIFIAWLIATNHLWWAGLLLVVFGLFDALDGALARVQHRATTFGRLLDAVSDRIKEVLLYGAVAYNIIAETGRPYLAIWAVTACGTALLVSYINAAGEAVVRSHHTNFVPNKVARVGIASFEVRMFILLIGLLSGRLTLAMIAITLLAIVTIVQRMVKVREELNV